MYHVIRMLTMLSGITCSHVKSHTDIGYKKSCQFQTACKTVVLLVQKFPFKTKDNAEIIIIKKWLMTGMISLFQAHPNTSKEEKKSLCRLIDARKLTAEAAAHAVQNDHLPVRSVMQVIFSEHGKLNRLTELSASFSSQRNPNPALELPGRCPSKREVLAQHQDVRRLREDVNRLQVIVAISSASLSVLRSNVLTLNHTYICRCNATLFRPRWTG
jgi:hypothetical protein